MSGLIRESTDTHAHTLITLHPLFAVGPNRSSSRKFDRHSIFRGVNRETTAHTGEERENSIAISSQVQHQRNDCNEISFSAKKKKKSIGKCACNGWLVHMEKEKKNHCFVLGS